MNPARVQTRRSEGAACGPNVQVFIPECSCRRISAGRRYVCDAPGGGGLCVISEVLNDLCSMRNWVALPELSVALTLKPSFVLENRQRAEAARSALFLNVKLMQNAPSQHPRSLRDKFIADRHVCTNKQH